MDYKQYPTYFNSIGYKYLSQYHDLIVKDFQRHVFPGQKKEWDGIIGFKTQAKIDFYNKANFCKEVFENIKPYKQYLDIEIESLCTRGLVNLGWAFNQYSKENDFNVLHSIAHAILESAYGTSFIARFKNNIYGWNAVDSSPTSSAYKLKDKIDCIAKWSYWFNKEYLLLTGHWYHGNSEYGVNTVYASSPVAGINKAFIVRQLRNQLNG